MDRFFQNSYWKEGFIEVNFNAIYLGRSTALARVSPEDIIYFTYLSQPKELVLKHFGNFPEHVSASSVRFKKKKERKEEKQCLNGICICPPKNFRLFCATN